MRPTRSPALKMRAKRRTAVTLLCVGAAAAAVAGPARAQTAIRSGDARFEVITSTLIRAEYAAGGTFENRPTQMALHREQPPVKARVSHAGGTLTIDTGRLRLHYVEGSGPFTTANLDIDIDTGGVRTNARPSWDACQQLSDTCNALGGMPGTAGADPTALGGYGREAVDVGGVFPPLHPGLLHTTGWYLLEDTATALRTGPGRAVARPPHPPGGYQDGYLFAYGHDYRRGLADLRRLTGAAPLLPRYAFGPWFSRYFAYSAADYRNQVVPAFRAHRTPLDVLPIDTDAKAPNRRHGWQFNATRYPNPKGFFSFLGRERVHPLFNIHPSIDTTDPAFTPAQNRAHGRLKTGPDGCKCYVFDWGDPDQTAAYFGAHRTFEGAGIRTFWLDWCCDASQVSTPGLTPDGWINELYAEHQRAAGGRGWVLSRLGSGYVMNNGASGDLVAPASGPWAEHRSTIPFTGDANSKFQTLDYEARMTPAEGAATGTPYISHDIGGYTGKHLPDDLYVRWVQMGTFSPILRLHSNHGERLPWEYPGAAEAAAERFLRLREQLVPYLYATAMQARETGVPMARLLALDWPALADVKDEWMLGDSMLFAPITGAGTTASRSVVLPPGRWTDFFSGQTIQGPRTVTATAGFSRAPVWIRAGGIVPMSGPLPHAGTADPLTLRVARGASGRTVLYEDGGDGQAYEHGAATRQALTYTESRRHGGRLRVGRSRGRGPGAPRQRSYIVQVAGVRAAPARVRVNGHRIARKRGGLPLDLAVTTRKPPRGDGFRWDAKTRTLTISLHRRPTRRGLTLTWF